MEIIEKITLDMLSEDSVSVLRQKFEVQEDETLLQIGDNVRNAFMNTADNREYLQENLPTDKWNELIMVWGDTPTVVPPEPVEPDLTELKTSVIKNMDNILTQTIYSGVDVTLTDGTIQHFSLTMEDQKNIENLAAKAQAGLNPFGYTNSEGVPMYGYHADDNLCRWYYAEDILNIYTMGEQYVLLLTTYFNSLKMYIQSLDDANTIKSIVFGCDIPVEYQSDVLKLFVERGDLDFLLKKEDVNET